MRWIYGVAMTVAVVGVASCGNGGSAVETRSRDEAPSAQVQPLVASEALAEQPQEELAAEKVAPAKAAAVLTSNRRETASDKAVRLYERNGRDFGAKSAEDYLEKAEAFTRNTPRDAEKVSRPNGDVLIYQASTNTFAVVDRRGVVRTMFKPSNGAAYWQDQKASAPSFGR